MRALALWVCSVVGLAAGDADAAGPDAATSASSGPLIEMPGGDAATAVELAAPAGIPPDGSFAPAEPGQLVTLGADVNGHRPMVQRLDTPAGDSFPAVDRSGEIGHSAIGGPLGRPLNFYLDPPVDQVLSSP